MTRRELCVQPMGPGRINSLTETVPHCEMTWQIGGLREKQTLFVHKHSPGDKSAGPSEWRWASMRYRGRQQLESWPAIDSERRQWPSKYRLLGRFTFCLISSGQLAPSAIFLYGITLPWQHQLILARNGQSHTS